ncbi:MAG: NfeD family protein [Halanaerobiaceae bacterium]
MSTWLIWTILGFFLLIYEIITPEFVVGSFALGCFAAAGVSLVTTSLFLQLLVFALVTAFVLWKIRPVFLAYLDSGDARTNTGLLVGEIGRVLEPVGPREETGRVKIGGEDWLAVSDKGIKLEKGARVEILAVKGSKLIVKHCNENKEEC